MRRFPALVHDFGVDRERGERVGLGEGVGAAERAAETEDAGRLHAREFAKGGPAVPEIVERELRRRRQEMNGESRLTVHDSAPSWSRGQRVEAELERVAFQHFPDELFACRYSVLAESFGERMLCCRF